MSDNAVRIRTVIAHTFGWDVEDVTDEKSFEELGADSLEVLEMVIRVERVLGIEIPDDDADRMKTVGDLVQFVEAFGRDD